MAPGTVSRNPFSRNRELAKFVKDGQKREALDRFRKLRAEGMLPDIYTYVIVLNACAGLRALEDGRRVHSQIVESGYEGNVFVATTLLHMYSKCGSIEDAQRVFNKMPNRTIVSWNAMIRAHVKSGQGREALDLYKQMQVKQVKPDLVTYLGLLNACACATDAEMGRQIHAQIAQSALQADLSVGNSLIDMYAKCGSVGDARRVFSTMPVRDLVSWNAMIAGYVKCGQAQNALNLSLDLRKDGLEPDHITFVGILNACASIRALDVGKLVHEEVVKRGLESNIFVGSSLVDMYAKCGSINDSLRVFTQMPVRNLVSWNSMIAGYVKCGCAEKALDLAREMRAQHVKADGVTFVALLNACAALQSIGEGRRLHSEVIQSNIEGNTFVRNSLVAMYAKCGDLDEAQRVFSSTPVRTLVSWNAMMGGCVRAGNLQRALEFYQQIRSEQMKPDAVTYVQLLNGCAGVGSLEQGRELHSQAIQDGCEDDLSVASSLVDMYVKCGSIEEASRTFENMTVRNVEAWNAMIMGYVRHGETQKALELYWRMEEEGLISPEPLTFVAALNACASIAAFEEGRRVHEQTRQKGCEQNLYVANSLINMYAKCGSIEDASLVFNAMPARDLVTFHALLGGYAASGQGIEALRLFETICEEKLPINRVTFVCLLSACSHAGLVDEGLHYINSMSAEWGVSPAVDHFSCVIDLLSRAGRLHEAEEVIQSMPCEPDMVAWKTLLGACRVHGNVEMGERIGQLVVELDPGTSPGYVLLSNIYASAGKWESKAQVHEMMSGRGVKKRAGCAWIVVGNQVHSFAADDQAHPRILQVRSELRRLRRALVSDGYVPDFRNAMLDATEREKVRWLWDHSEKLAVAFGLLSTPPGTCLRILKNLRMCNDCHQAIKLIAKLSKRRIIVRDHTRFHHFEDDICSCNDYW